MDRRAGVVTVDRRTGVVTVDRRTGVVTVDRRTGVVTVDTMYIIKISCFLFAISHITRIDSETLFIIHDMGETVLRDWGRDLLHIQLHSNIACLHNVTIKILFFMDKYIAIIISDN